MRTIELTINGIKCPLCDLLHNYKVQIEYDESGLIQGNEKPYYNFLVKDENGPNGPVQIPVYEVDAYCPKKSSPFRIIVEPRIPINSVPVSIKVSVL